MRNFSNLSQLAGSESSNSASEEDRLSQFDPKKFEEQVQERETESEDRAKQEAEKKKRAREIKKKSLLMRILGRKLNMRQNLLSKIAKMKDGDERKNALEELKEILTKEKNELDELQRGKQGIEGEEDPQEIQKKKKSIKNLQDVVTKLESSETEITSQPESSTEQPGNDESEVESLTHILATKSRGKLRDRLRLVRRQLGELKLQQEREDGSNLEIEVQIHLLETQEKQLELAITQRDIDNYNIVLAATGLNKFNDDTDDILTDNQFSTGNDDEPETTRQARSTIDRIKEIKVQIITRFHERNNNISEEDSDSYYSLLDEFRIEFDRFKRLRNEVQGDSSSQDEQVESSPRGEVLAESLGVESQRQVKELIQIFPKSELRLLKERAGQGDSEALEQYVDKLKKYLKENPDYISRLTPETRDSEFIARIQELQEETTLNEDDQIEFYTLTGTLFDYFDADSIAGRLTDLQADSDDFQRFSVGLSQGRLNRLREITGDSDGENLQLLQASGEKLRKALDDLIEKNMSKVEDDGSQELLTRAENVFNAQLEDIYTLLGFESRLGLARQDLAQDLIQRWLDRNQRRAKIELGYEKEGEIDNPLSLEVIRGRFQLNGIPMRDIDLHRDEIISDATQENPELAEQIQTAYEKLKEGSWALYEWENAETGDDTRREAARAVERAVLKPPSDAAQDEIEAAETLLQSALDFRDKEKEVEAFIRGKSTENDAGEFEANESLHKFAFKNIILNNILARNATETEESRRLNQNQIENLKTALKNVPLGDEDESLEDFFKRIEGAIDGVIENQQPTATEQAKQDLEFLKGKGERSNPSEQKSAELITLSQYFSVERVPAGIGIRFLDAEAMNAMLGVAAAPGEVRGVTFNEDNIIDNEGEEFAGGMIAYNGKVENSADLHEIRHLIDKYALNIMGDKEVRTSYSSMGIDEIVARIKATESVPGQDYESTPIETDNFQANLLELGLTPEDNDINADITEKHKQTLLIYSMVNDILKTYNPQANQDSPLSQVEYDMLKRNLIAKLYSYSNKPEELIHQLSADYDGVKFGGLDAVGRSQSLEESGDIGNLIDRLYNNYTEGQTNPYIGVVVDPNQTSAINQSLQQISELNDIYQFAMVNQHNVDAGRRRVLGIPVPFTNTVRSVGESGIKPAFVPDALPWEKGATAFMTSTGKKSFDEGGHPIFRQKHKSLDFFLDRNKMATFYEEDAPVSWMPFGKTPVLKYVAAPVNGLITGALKKVYMHNTRDLSSAWNGTAFGRYLGLNPDRPGDLAKRAAYFPGKTAEYFVEDNMPGAKAGSAYTGFQFPDFIRELNLNDRHMQATNALQSAAGGGPEVYGLEDSNYFADVTLIPNSRPDAKPTISAMKADKIPEAELRRMQIARFNPDSYRDYLESTEGGIPSFAGGKVYIDEFGRFVYELNGQKRMLSADEARRIFGWKAMLQGTGKEYFGNWRARMIEYKGKEYYVNYDPNTGLPGLYEKEYIDWRTENPRPLMENGERVQPRFGREIHAVGGTRHKMEVEYSARVLFQKIMQLRRDQIELQREAYRRQNNGSDAGFVPDESKLYSFRDLIWSVQNYEDPQAGPDNPPFVEKLKGKAYDMKQIYLPSARQDGEPLEVDYEAALRLITEAETFFLQDRTVNQGYIKQLQAEFIQTPEQIPHHEKVRDMVREYISLLNNDNLFGLDGGGNVVHRYQQILDKDPSQVTQQELEVLQQYSMLKDLERILFNGQYSLFEGFGNDDEGRKALRTLRESITKDIFSYKNNRIAAINANGALTPQQKAAAIEALNSYINSTPMETTATAANGNSYVATTLTGSIIDKLLNNRKYRVPGRNEISDALIYENDVIRNAAGLPVGGGATPITIVYDHTAGAPPVVPGDPVPTETTNQYAGRNLINVEYDKRTQTRFMESATDYERAQTALNIERGKNDGIKYRQELKDFALQAKQHAFMINHEYLRWRRSKSLWQDMSGWGMRFATIAAFGAIAALAATGTPMAIWIILAALGFTRYLTPLFDRNAAIDGNRRKAAQELSLESRQMVAQIQEMFDKGGTLSAHDKMSLELKIEKLEQSAEAIHGIGAGDSFSPKKMFLLGKTVPGLLDQQLAKLLE